MEFKLASGLESLVEDFGIPGIAAVVLLPVLVPVATSVAKPLAKAVIKGGIVLYEKGKEAMSEMSEGFEDIVAEVRTELGEEKPQDVQRTEIQVEGS